MLTVIGQRLAGVVALLFGAAPRSWLRSMA
jgi:hypothetical protein